MSKKDKSKIPVEKSRFDLGIFGKKDEDTPVVASKALVPLGEFNEAFKENFMKDKGSFVAIGKTTRGEINGEEIQIANDIFIHDARTNGKTIYIEDAQPNPKNNTTMVKGVLIRGFTPEEIEALQRPIREIVEGPQD